MAGEGIGKGSGKPLTRDELMAALPRRQSAKKGASASGDTSSRCAGRSSYPILASAVCPFLPSGLVPLGSEIGWKPEQNGMPIMLGAAQQGASRLS